MFERFTKRGRAAVEAAVGLAEEQQAVEVRPEHLLAGMLRDGETVAAVVLADQGATGERVLAELERRRGKYADGLGDDDAEALATIGIDLEEVLRRIEPLEPGPRRKRGHRRFAKGS